MKSIARQLTAVGMLLTMGGWLIACGSGSSGSAPGTVDGQTAQNLSSKQIESSSTQTATETETRAYTDHAGHAVSIPVQPQRIVFHGETVGDLIALGIQPIASASSFIDGTVFADKTGDIADLGFPINIEKTTELEPDLILYANNDEKIYQSLSQIAPTLIFNTFAPLDQRILELGDITGYRQQAEQWLASYRERTERMWDKLHDAGVKEGETATVLTYYPGDRLFVMLSTGLSQILYEKQGFKAPDPVQKLLDTGKGFEQISMELLDQFAGDRIFILTPVPEEAKASTEAMLQSPLWQQLPAVKNGHVYMIDIMKSSSDAATREWLLDYLPQILTETE